MAEVIVTNTTKEDLVDRWNGEEYRFPSGKGVTIPEHVAHHIFGWGDEDREAIVIRLGWTDTRKDLPQALDRLDKFKIVEKDPSKTRPSLSPGAERVPLQSPDKVAGGKLAIAAP